MSFDLRIQNGDIKISRDGDLDVVLDNEKIRQDIIKILLTKLGENKYHTYYGSSLGALEIGGVPDREIVEGDLLRMTEESMAVLMRLQSNQAGIQYITPGETIVDILNVDIDRDVSDPRGYNVSVTVLTRKLTKVTESVTVRIL
jgi:phage baseplate assembly protein W